MTHQLGHQLDTGLPRIAVFHPAATRLFFVCVSATCCGSPMQREPHQAGHPTISGRCRIHAHGDDGMAGELDGGREGLAIDGLRRTILDSRPVDVA